MSDTPAFTIVDDFLGEQDWTEVWSSFQFMDLWPVSRGAGAWKLDDGVPLGSEEAVTGTEGGEGPLGPVLRAIEGAGDAVLAQVQEPWDAISARAYVYPRGTGLSWHSDDSELYAGAYIYYAHPHWNAHWGGELLVAKAGNLPIMGHRFSTEDYSQALMQQEPGSFIFPRPNRLVLISGAAHQVSPVRDAAGENVRASVSGFFLRAGMD